MGKVFMTIDTFKNYCWYEKGYEGYFQICGYAFFNVIINLIIF